ncbi:MAG: MarR family transcriptional regulator [Acidimicrobiia bacterium]|nr:MarR family transcriptional regulator [Acidimicrobiia bacterium]
MAGRVEALEAINGLLASATIFTTASAEVLAAELGEVAGDRLTFTQLKLLRLVERQGHLTIGDVAAFLGISNAAASKAVDRLVRGGLLSRAESPGDRRATEVSITDEAERLLDEFDARASEMLLGLLAEVGVGRLRDLAEGLDRLSVSLSAASRDPDRVCFRCGLYLRDDCLLRMLSDRRCYRHLGPTRSSTGSSPRPGRSSTQIETTTGGNG